MTSRVKLTVFEVFKWTCPDCGAVNTEDLPQHRMTPEEKEHYSVDVNFIVPESVLCPCLSMFETEESIDEV